MEHSSVPVFMATEVVHMRHTEILLELIATVNYIILTSFIL